MNVKDIVKKYLEENNFDGSICEEIEVIGNKFDGEFMIYLQEIIDNQKLLLTAMQTGMIMFLDIQKQKNKTNQMRREAELICEKTKLQYKF